MTKNYLKGIVTREDALDHMLGLVEEARLNPSSQIAMATTTPIDGERWICTRIETAVTETQIGKLAEASHAMVKSLLDRLPQPGGGT